MRSAADVALAHTRSAEAAVTYERAVRSAMAGPADRFVAWNDDERRLILRADHASGERAAGAVRAVPLRGEGARARRRDGS